MAAAGTLATDAQILLAIGENASVAQVLGTNTDIWILMAEADIYIESGEDFVTDYASVTAVGKQFLASLASVRAAFYAINHNQNSWQLATTQSKLNVIDNIWQSGIKHLQNSDKNALLGFD